MIRAYRQSHSLFSSLSSRSYSARATGYSKRTTRREFQVEALYVLSFPRSYIYSHSLCHVIPVRVLFN